MELVLRGKLICSSGRAIYFHFGAKMSHFGRNRDFAWVGARQIPILHPTPITAQVFENRGIFKT